MHETTCGQQHNKSSSPVSDRHGEAQPSQCIPDIEQANHSHVFENVNIASYLVDWEPIDPANPKSWSSLYKAWITFQLGMLVMADSMASCIISPAAEQIAVYARVSSEVTVLTVSRYVLGSAFGPLSWAPISEE